MSDALKFDMPDATHAFEERGGWLVARLAADFNLQPFQAAGIVGNVGFESGGFRELQEIGVSNFERGGYGWAQWTGPRRRAFEAWCAENRLVPSSDEANYGYLAFELRGAYHGTIAAVSRTTTVEDAVFSVGQTYERPGGTTATFLPGFDGRLAYARRALAGIGQPKRSGLVPDIVPVDSLPAALQVALRRTLRLTSPLTTGEDVRELQTRLAALGSDPGLADGVFGSETAAAVLEFQTEHGLPKDGVVGPMTWAALNKGTK